ncbi:MAG: polysaccharide biosynthesis C-terminal domain-containing protein [Bacillota bacterium]
MVLDDDLLSPVKSFADERGELLEVFRGDHLPITGKGQVYLTTAFPGCIKGGHYHRHKTEWFCVVGGRAVVELQDVGTGASRVFTLDRLRPAVLRVPPNTIHRIRNPTDQVLSVIAYVDDVYNPDDPDTYPAEAPQSPAPDEVGRRPSVLIDW